MKKGMLLLLLVSSVFANAQSLKEALFSGKLKNEPGTVIRKGDDLSSKMDTTTRKAATNDTAITKVTPLTGDSSMKRLTVPTDSAALSGMDKKDTISASTDTAALEATAAAPKEVAPAPKDNNDAWKEYVNSIANTLKTEVLSSKKIKSGNYFVLVSYEIGTDGQVAISDVSLTPENAYLQQQIKERLSLDAPRLNPVLTSTG
ncbi:MAG: hypothetical protein M3342_00490, partial [Bacteroidota bacterium]|nr:hypothetical protein [Bacteroidota bacterium]